MLLTQGAASQGGDYRAAPERFLRQEYSHGAFGVFSQNLRALDQLGRILRIPESVIPNTQSLQNRLGHRARSAECSISDISGVINQKQNRDLILQERAHDPITAIEKTAVLHDRCTLFADEICTGTNADPLFFAAERNVYHLRVALRLSEQVGKIDVRKRCHEINTCAF